MCENGPVLHNCAAPQMRHANMNRIINDFFEMEERGQAANKLHLNKPKAIGQTAARKSKKRKEARLLEREKGGYLGCMPFHPISLTLPTLIKWKHSGLH